MQTNKVFAKRWAHIGLGGTVATLSFGLACTSWLVVQAMFCNTRLTCGATVGAWLTFAQAANPYNCHAPLQPPFQCFHPTSDAGESSCRCLLHLHPFQWPARSLRSCRQHACQPCRRRGSCRDRGPRVNHQTAIWSRLHHGHWQSRGLAVCMDDRFTSAALHPTKPERLLPARHRVDA